MSFVSWEANWRSTWPVFCAGKPGAQIIVAAQTAQVHKKVNNFFMMKKGVKG